MLIQDPLNVKNLENLTRSGPRGGGPPGGDPAGGGGGRGGEAGRSVVHFRAPEDSAQLEDSVRDFVTALFWVLEGKR